MLIPSHIERHAMEAVSKEFFPEGIPEDFQEDFQKAFQKGFQEKYQQGLQEGSQIARREIILEVLIDRLNSVPQEVTDRINQISDYENLKQLLERGMSIESVAEFEEVLESLLARD